MYIELHGAVNIKVNTTLLDQKPQERALLSAVLIHHKGEDVIFITKILYGGGAESDQTRSTAEHRHTGGAATSSHRANQDYESTNKSSSSDY